MPTSRPEHLTWLCNQILLDKPKSILDVGCGFGSKGVLFREYTDIWQGNYDKKEWKTRIDAVEVYNSYLTEMHDFIYNNIYIGDIMWGVDKLPAYELIYCGDIIEHLSKTDGRILIDKLLDRAKTLIIATPIIVSEQKAVFGNTYEEHRSQWGLTDFNGAELVSYGNVLLAKYETRIYYCNAMGFYGDKAKKKFNYKFYDVNKDIYKNLFFLGLYFEEDYDTYAYHRGKRRVFWNGSDVLRLLDNSKWIDILHKFPAKHFCHNEQLEAELKSVGIEAEVCPMFFSNEEDYKFCYQDSDKPHYYMTAHPGREIEYGVDKVLEYAKTDENSTYHIYGLTGDSTRNVIYHGWIDEKIMDEQIKDMQACIRLNKHDGYSQLVMKAELMGHKVIRSLTT